MTIHSSDCIGVSVQNPLRNVIMIKTHFISLNSALVYHPPKTTPPLKKKTFIFSSYKISATVSGSSIISFLFLPSTREKYPFVESLFFFYSNLQDICLGLSSFYCLSLISKAPRALQYSMLPDLLDHLLGVAMLQGARWKPYLYDSIPIGKPLSHHRGKNVEFMFSAKDKYLLTFADKKMATRAVNSLDDHVNT